MNTKTILAENLGPIASLEFAMQGPGVTVLVAPNGSGKTILLEAVQAAARGEGKLPLRDRTRRGRVEAFGATITIGGTCRHTGGFEVTNLEGRFDLASLVDPRLKTPSVADNARIKALVSLTGVVASVAKFKEHEALATSFDSVVKASSTDTEDFVEMARKIKDDYDTAARAKEDQAERETGQARALVAPPDLDLEDESDADVLQEAYGEARDYHTRLVTQAETAKNMEDSHAAAQKTLDSLAVDSLSSERDSLTKLISSATVQIEINTSSIEELKRKIDELMRSNDTLRTKQAADKVQLETTVKQLALVAQAQETIKAAVATSPSPEDLDEAAEAVRVAAAAVERGTLIREALKNAAKAAGHRKAATLAKDTAAKYRDAGKATDEVLSNCIKSPYLRVESDGKAARLVTDSTERGKSVPYHDLSDGEKWTIAIDIGADQVGAGGLLVISQIGWEGIDGLNRMHIHAKAVQRDVYILTAEASSDPEADRVIHPLRLPDVDVPVKTPPPQAEPVEEAKPPAKPAPKPKATPKPKEQPKPVEPPVSDGDFTDDDDIPF